MGMGMHMLLSLLCAGLVLLLVPPQSTSTAPSLNPPTPQTPPHTPTGAVQHGEAEAGGEGGQVVGAHPESEARGGRRDVQGPGLGQAERCVVVMVVVRIVLVGGGEWSGGWAPSAPPAVGAATLPVPLPLTLDHNHRTTHALSLSHPSSPPPPFPPSSTDIQKQTTAKSWKRMVTKVTFVGDNFTRKAPKCVSNRNDC